MAFKLASGEKPLHGYVIRRGLGIGGFGEVYFAVSDSGKEVALKRIHRNLEVEVRGASHCLNLRHPNLVQLYDIRQEDSEQAWIVMEYVAGESLLERLDRHPKGLESDDALRLFGQMAAGVQYLHDQGIVHRDLKPANIFIENDWVKIGDYGLSKFISASRRGGQTESVGTFHYMAPEIGKGEYGKEIDIYALGIMLYEMLTGKVPFDGESSQEIILKHLTADPDLSRLPLPFRSVVMKALAKDPSQRYTSVIAMLEPLGMSIDQNGLSVFKSNRETSQASRMFDTPEGRGYPDKTVSPTPNVESPRFYREPIANEIAIWLAELQTRFNRIRYGSRWYVLTLVGAIFFLVHFGPILVPVVVMAAVCYIPYYIAWYLMSGRYLPPLTKVSRAHQGRTPTYQREKDSKPTFRPSAAAVRRPLSFQEWQIKQRVVLASKPFANRWSEWTASALLATFVLGVLSLGGYLTTLATYPAWAESTSFIAIGVWLVSMTLMATWTVLFFAKRWENRPEDSLIYRFVMLACGLVIGGIGWVLSEYLMVPWESMTTVRFVPRSLDWNGFSEGQVPEWPAFVAYFGLLMGSVRWWRQADFLRRYRFSIVSILWTVIIAAFIGGLVYFPNPWCLIVAGVTSALTQMATQNLDSRSRLRFEEVVREDEVKR